MTDLNRRAALGFGTAALALSLSGIAAAAPRRVQALKITVLSTMLADEGLGEWGYCALVEADGKKILFDTGAHPDLVIGNAKALKVDLSDVEEVVLSHNHPDHTGGLPSVRKALMAGNPKAAGIAHVSTNIFTPRIDAAGNPSNPFAVRKADYEALGGRFVVHDGPSELAPGVWHTGPAPRANPETNWNPGLRIVTSAGPVEDTVPDDSALVFDTADGLVVLTGCGHAGIVNICEYARKVVEPAPLLAVGGGLHLYAKPDATIDWTAGKLKAMGLRYLLAGHCTGIEATMRLRQQLGLTRQTAVVSAVGSSFTLGKGIYAGEIAA